MQLLENIDRLLENFDGLGSVGNYLIGEEDMHWFEASELYAANLQGWMQVVDGTLAIANKTDELAIWRNAKVKPVNPLLAEECGTRMSILLKQIRDKVSSEQNLENPLESTNRFIDLTRIRELKSIQNSKFDLSKLIRFCEELNFCYSKDCYLAVAVLLRAIIDHIPPIFGCKHFSEVANNYLGSKSFKNSMKHLDASSRNIADAHLHVQIRGKEVLPNDTQVNFSNDIDVLLSEIVRILK